MSRPGSHRRWLMALAVICCAVAGTVATVLACGPFLTDLMTVARYQPAYSEPYSRGELGVVKPQFFRRYLVQAYRVFNGRPAMASVTDRFENPSTTGWPPRDWTDLLVREQ